MGIWKRSGDGGWTVEARVALVGVVVAVIGLVIAIAAWQDPKMPRTEPSNSQSSASQSDRNTADPPTTGGPEPSQVRYLAELPPVTGGSFVSNGGPADRHAMVIHCASGQSNDRSREVSWNIPGPYSTLVGRVTISGKLDPEHQMQLEWFADGARIYNNSTLTLATETDFRGELGGAQDLRVRLTCTSSAGIATLLDASVQR